MSSHGRRQGKGFIERVRRRVNLKNFMTCFQSMTVYDVVALKKEENAAKQESKNFCKTLQVRFSLRKKREYRHMYNSTHGAK